MQPKVLGVPALDHRMECLSGAEHSDNGTHGKKDHRPLSPAPALAIDQKATNDRPARISKSVDILIRGYGVLPKTRSKERYQDEYSGRDGPRGGLERFIDCSCRYGQRRCETKASEKPQDTDCCKCVTESNAQCEYTSK